MKKSLISLIILSLVFLVSGCAHKEPEVRTAKDIFQEATDLARKGKTDKAAEKFMEVRTYYPGDELAKKSLLETADLYYNDKNYPSALESYDEFRLLYPTDPESGYCLYRIAMCHFNQIGTFDRDQKETVSAIQTFESFIETYPDSPYVRGAKDNIEQAKTTLAKHYLSIGKYYLKKKKYEAACNRFQYVKSLYGGLDLEEDLDALISRSCGKQKKQAKP